MIVEMRSEGLIQRSALSLEGHEVQVRPFKWVLHVVGGYSIERFGCQLMQEM